MSRWRMARGVAMARHTVAAASAPEEDVGMALRRPGERDSRPPTGWGRAGTDMSAAEERAQAVRRRRSRALVFVTAVVLAGFGGCWLLYQTLEQPPELLEPYRLRNLLNAAKLYRMDTGRFPST